MIDPQPPAVVAEPAVAKPEPTPADLAAMARRDRAETVRDVRMGKRAPQDRIASDKDFDFKVLMARAAESLKLKGRGRRVKVSEWTTAAVTP